MISTYYCNQLRINSITGKIEDSRHSVPTWVMEDHPLLEEQSVCEPGPLDYPVKLKANSNV